MPGESRERGQLQRLGTPPGSMPAEAMTFAACRPRASAKAQGIREVFRRWVNIDRTMASKMPSSRTGTAGGRNVSRTTAERTFGRRTERAGRQRQEPAHVRMALDQDGQHTVVAGPGPASIRSATSCCTISVASQWARCRCAPTRRKRMGEETL